MRRRKERIKGEESEIRNKEERRGEEQGEEGGRRGRTKSRKMSHMCQVRRGTEVEEGELWLMRKEIKEQMRRIITTLLTCREA